MKQLINLWLAIILIISIPLHSIAQKENQVHSANQRHLLLSSGISFVSYRDFATSPLFYQGSGTNLFMGSQYINQNRELNWGLNFLINLTSANVPQSDFFEVSSMGIFSGLEGNLTYLRNFKPWLNEKYDFKLGGTLLGNQNLRINPSLDNSSTGIESLINLMLSAKAERDISRKKESVKRFLFMSFHQRPVRRTLSFQIDAGVINLNHRPSYAYAYFSPIDGTKSTMLSHVLDSYSWSMNGWRLRTRLEFTQFNSSGNARKIGYEWDALHAPGKYAAYQMGMHRIEYIILINNQR